MSELSTGLCTYICGCHALNDGLDEGRSLAQTASLGSDWVGAGGAWNFTTVSRRKSQSPLAPM